MKARRLGVVMDPIGTIVPRKDSTLAMLLEAQQRRWTIEYMELGDLSIRDGQALGAMRRLRVRDDPEAWFELAEAVVRPLGELDIILMRKDPPVDAEYIAATFILERAEAAGSLVVNSPRTLRDANEKCYTSWFPQCCPPSLLTRSIQALQQFLAEHRAIVLKPLDGMGGRSVFVVREDDPNRNVILEEMTRQETRFVQAQAFVADVAVTGDKRILLIDGQPVSQAIIRIPAAGELRANLALGSSWKAAGLSERERWICGQIGPDLKARGLLLVGIDVIGGCLTEINVTSPTCLREIRSATAVNPAADFFDAIEMHLDTKSF